MMEDQSEEISINPTLTDDLVEDLEKIKGDAIGNTLYSEKWVLKTLIKISQYTGNEWTDEFEKDLCSLWDMTVERDVVNFLMKYDIIPTISRLISISDSSSSTNNSRMREIMVGLLGNMCCVSENVRAELSRSEETIYNLLRLFDIPDAPVLVQLIRLLHATAWDLLKDKGNLPNWLESELNNSRICNYLTFILKSSTNDELLCCVLEFLNTLCSVNFNDKDFSQYFATSDLICGMLESWDQLFANWSNEDDLLNKQNKKVVEHWTGILSSFTGHVNGRTALGKNCVRIGDILNKIIRQPFESADVVILSAVNILDSIVTVYFNGAALKMLLVILNKLYQTAVTSTDNATVNTDSLDVLLLKIIETYCVDVTKVIDNTTLNETLRDCCENHVLLFWKAVNERQVDDDDDDDDEDNDERDLFV